MSDYTTTGGIEITIDGSKAKVKSPYHPAFITKARNLNGKWSAPHWIFDARDEAMIRQACVEIYGTDGTPVPAVDVEVDLDKYPCSGPSYYGLGRLLVERKSRDYRVVIGDGVSAISGGFGSSGGSVKNPRPDEKAGTVLLVRDVPRDLAMKFEAEYAGLKILDRPETAEPKPSPLAGFTTDDLIAELKSRGITTL